MQSLHHSLNTTDQPTGQQQQQQGTIPGNNIVTGKAKQTAGVAA
jgi:hypothetical protein